MPITLWGIAGVILMFVAIIGTGFWMSSSGKPFNTAIFTLHKLISLAALAIMIVVTVKTSKASGLNGYALTGVIATGFLFLGTMVTGGMLSVDKVMPSIVLRLHQILPFVTTISSGLTLFLLK